RCPGRASCPGSATPGSGEVDHSVVGVVAPHRWVALPEPPRAFSPRGSRRNLAAQIGGRLRRRTPAGVAHPCSGPALADLSDAGARREVSTKRAGRAAWQRCARVATSDVLALGSVGCGGPSDESDDGSGGDSSTTESSDNGGASDDGGASDGGGMSDDGGSDDGGDSAADAGDYGPGTDLRTDAPPVEAQD